MTWEIVILVVALGACGVWRLIHEFGKCAKETAEAIEESEQEEWGK